MRVAEQSPRIAGDGTIRWYHGDTFILTFEFHLKDSNGSDIEASESDKIEVYIKDYRNEIVANFTSYGSTKIDVNVTKTISERLVEGVYTLSARFNGTFVTTLLKNNKVVVE